MRKPNSRLQGALETEDILRKEAEAIHNAVGLSDKKDRALYRALNLLNSAALCLSGGGIRSAAFALGVMQALAVHPRSLAGQVVDKPERSLLSGFHYLSTVSGGGYIGSWLSAWRARNDFRTLWNDLIGRPCGSNIEPKPINWLRSYSNYLTPRTGFLSADSWAAVALYIGNLTINWLVILPFICAVILLLKFVVWVLIWATLLDEYPLNRHNALLAGLGVVFLIKALAFVTRHRPSFQSGEGVRRKGATQGEFLRGHLVYSVFSAIALVQFLGSNFAGAHLVKHCVDADLAVEMCSESSIDQTTYLNQPILPIAGWVADGTLAMIGIIAIGGIIGLLIYAMSWLWGDRTRVEPASLRIRSIVAISTVLRLLIYPIAKLWDDMERLVPSTVKSPPSRREPFSNDFRMWTLSGSVYGALVGFGFYLYLLLPDEEIVPFKQLNWFTVNPVMYLIVGVPWILLSQVIAEIFFAGLNNEKNAGADWEWLARGAGWKLAAALSWMLAMLLTFPNFQESELIRQLSWVIPVGAISGFVIAVLGMSRLSPGRDSARTLVEKATNFLLTIAAPMFAAALVFTLSIMLDKLVFGASGAELLPTGFPSLETMDDYRTWFVQLGLIFLALIISAAVGFCLSRRININRCSLHTVYRDRLIRAFLGASRERNPDQFTDMDADDNPRMHTLWSHEKEGGWQPFHVINTTLNIVSAKRLAWQERKAASFTVSPLHCGTGSTLKKDKTGTGTDIPVGAYRCAREYGGPGGISLGTAMAISGAAASPNMGYHSSPAITFLMAMLNVRLGWWFGNPAEPGEKTYALDGPADAIKPLVQEAFGLTTDDQEYVYLSDGGHFENLGLYEMVRRRCRFIVLIDAGCDPEFTFEDLGNALRKIKIDLGVSIRLNGLEALKKRPDKHSDVLSDCEYHAIGVIDYASADGGQNGIVLYVKPGYHGTERVEIQSYATAHRDFPHQSTANQSFGESQFESYRALGFDIMDCVLNKAIQHGDCPSTPRLEDVLNVLYEISKSQITQHNV